MIKGLAAPSEAFKPAAPLITTYVGNTIAGRSVTTLHRRKTKGIPALHWTTLHSPFGNRDRSGNKSFAAQSRPAAADACYHRASRIKFLPEGLFDPTFTKDQLESDERKRDLQRRRRLRDSTDPSVRLREKVPRVSHSSHAHHSQSTEEIPNVDHGRFAVSEHSWKREPSLSELLLAGPTFRETIAREGKIKRAVNVRRCSSIDCPEEVPVTQGRHKLHDSDWAGQMRFTKQIDMQGSKQIESLLPTQPRHKSVGRIQRRQAHTKSSGSKGGTATALRVTASFPQDYAHSTTAVKMLERTKQPSSFNVAPSAELCLSGYRVNANSLGMQPSNFPRTASGPDALGTSMLPCYNRNFCGGSTNSNTISGFQGNIGFRAIGKRCMHRFSETLDRVHELQQRVAVGVSSETIKQGLPSMREGSTAKGHLWLEGVVIELAEALRRGPPDGTEEAKNNLLSFLQQQRGQVLRRKAVLQLIKRIRRRLRQTAKKISAELPRGALASAAQSRPCLKSSSHCSPRRSHYVTQLYPDLGTNHLQSKFDSFAKKLSRQRQLSLPGAPTASALLKPGAKDFQPESTILPVEDPTNHVQEDSKHQNHCVPPMLDCLEVSADIFHRKAAQSENAEDCTSRNMRLEQQGSLLNQGTCDLLSCLVRLQETDCNASMALQSIENLPYSSASQKESAVPEGRVGIQEKKIRAAPAQHPGPFSNFPNLRETIRLKPSTEIEERPFKGAIQSCILSSAVEEKILAFRESRRTAQLKEEPLLQQESLQQALIRLKEENGGRACFENELAGIWMLHDAIVEQLLDREMKQLVFCADSATRMFVDRLIETETNRMEELMKPARHSN